MTIFIIIGLALLIIVHELGHFLMAKFFKVKVEEFGIGFPPKLLAKKIGETIYSLNLLPLGGFVKIYGEDFLERIEIQDQERSFSHQPIWRRSLIVLAGIFMNIIFAWLLLSFVLMIGLPSRLFISKVFPDSPAFFAGLKSGDLIIEARSQNFVLKDPIPVQDFINLVNQAVQENLLINLKVKRGMEVLEFEIKGRSNPPSGQGALGVALNTFGLAKRNFFKSFYDGFKITFNNFLAFTFYFYQFIGDLFWGKADLEQVAGPVGVFVLASQAGSLGFIYFLHFLSLISLNLAVLNLFPLPILDGGRFFLLILEKIKGSALSPKFKLFVYSLSFILILALILLVTVKDINRFL